MRMNFVNGISAVVVSIVDSGDQFGGRCRPIGAESW